MIRLLLGLAMLALTVWWTAPILLEPVPAATADRPPLLRETARGERPAETRTVAERRSELRRTLDAAHPPGGPTVVNVFGGGEASTPPFAGFPALYAPQSFRASAQEGGFRLRWAAHPRNPVEGLRYRLERWNPDGELEATWVLDALEHVDRVACEGVPYVYRVSARMERTLVVGGRPQPLIRRSPSARLGARLERRAEWRVTGLDAAGHPLLALHRPERPVEGPFRAEPGRPLGDTGWQIESWTKGETELPVVTRVPRFDEFGRRVVVDGRPASRSREDLRTKAFVTLDLIDPCGVSVRPTLFLPDEGPR